MTSSWMRWPRYLETEKVILNQRWIMFEAHCGLKYRRHPNDGGLFSLFISFLCFTDTCSINIIKALQWRHNERDSVSHHQPHDCLLNRLFRRRSKKTSKLRVTGLCAWNSPGTGEFPAQMASYAENVSIWWRHHGMGYIVPIPTRKRNQVFWQILIPGIMPESMNNTLSLIRLWRKNGVAGIPNNRGL